MKIGFVGIIILFLGCGISFDFDENTMDTWHSNIAYVDVKTTPDKAKLTLITVDRSVGSTVATSYAPQRVYYIVSLPSKGSYLEVTHPGYKKRIIRLNREIKENINIELEPDIIEKKQDISSQASLKLPINYADLPDFFHLLENKIVHFQIDSLISNSIGDATRKDSAK